MNEQKELYEQLINEELKYCSVEDLKFFYCLIAENNIKYGNKIEEKVSWVKKEGRLEFSSFPFFY